MKALILSLFLVSCSAKYHVVKKAEVLDYSKLNVSKTKLAQISSPISIVNITKKSETIGFAYTGVQYQKTPIVLDINQEAFFRDFITFSFEERGILVRTISENRLSIEIEKLNLFEVIEKLNPERAKCELKLNFKLEKPNKTWTSSIESEYLSKGDMRDGTNWLVPAFANCLNEAIEKVLDDPEFINIISTKE